MSRRPIPARLSTGELTLDRAAELARESALRTLAASTKSRAELANALARKGFPDEVVLPLLDRLTAVGLLDDAAYASAIVRTRLAEKGQARQVIAAELRCRGIPEEIATDALAAIDEESEHAAAKELAERLLRRSVGLDRQVRLRRAVAALVRRGHSPGVAFEICMRILEVA